MGLVRRGRWCWTMGASVWKPPREKCWQRGGDVWHKAVPAIPALLGHLWVPSAATSQAGGFPVDPQLWRHLKILYHCTDPAMGHPQYHTRSAGSKPNPTQNVKPNPGQARMLPAHPPTPTNSHSIFWLHIPGQGHPWDTRRVTQAFPRVGGVLIYIQI